MLKRLHMIGGDARTPYVLEFLSQWGYRCETYHVPGLPDTFSPSDAEVQCWLLPYPAVRDGKICGTADAVADFLSWVRPGQAVIGGGLCGLRDAGVCIELAEDEQLLWRNAVATAEGAVALTVELLPCALRETSCLVIGYGRIGRILAKMLRALHADVTVSARKERDLAALAAEGFASEHTGAWQAPLSRYRCILNTVPHPVFSDGQIDALGKDCVFLDLASAPYGVTAEQALRLQKRYHRAGGLPGKLSPESAGLYYAQAVRRKLDEEAL